jgi:hypothetical protein
MAIRINHSAESNCGLLPIDAAETLNLRYNVGAVLPAPLQLRPQGVGGYLPIDIATE